MWLELEMQYVHRSNRQVREHDIEAGMGDLDVVVLKRRYSFAGHLARLQVHDPSRMTCRVLNYRSCRECRTRQVLTGSQGHPGIYFIGGWESQFDRSFMARSLDWQEVALDKRAWMRHVEPWCRSRVASQRNPLFPA